MNNDPGGAGLCARPIRAARDGRPTRDNHRARIYRGKNMKIRYFADTDTALIEFSSAPVVETREITENLYIDLDQDGNLVSMTIEHAKI